VQHKTKQQRRRAGYSLIELVILFVVLAFVSGFIWVNRQYFLPEPPPGAEALTTELVRMGINNYALKSQTIDRLPVFPRTLDDAPVGTVASHETPLFTNVLPEGVRAIWEKVGANQYIFRPDPAEEKTDLDDVYFYDPGSGSFGKGEEYNKSLTVRRPPASLDSRHS
jgi:hypothetical protein